MHTFQREPRVREANMPEQLEHKTCCGTTCDPRLVAQQHTAQFEKGARGFAHFLAEHDLDVDELAVHLVAFLKEQE